MHIKSWSDCIFQSPQADTGLPCKFPELGLVIRGKCLLLRSLEAQFRLVMFCDDHFLLSRRVMARLGRPGAMVCRERLKKMVLLINQAPFGFNSFIE